MNRENQSQNLNGFVSEAKMSLNKSLPRNVAIIFIIIGLAMSILGGYIYTTTNNF